MKKNRLIILGLLAVLAFSGCVKDPEDPGYARYMIVNAAPDIPNIDVFVDNEKQNIIPINFGANTIYNGVTPGDRGITVTIGGTKNVFAEARYMVANNASVIPTYTFLALHRQASAELLWIQDDLSLPAAGKAHLRIIHASPDAPRVNAFVGASVSPIFIAATGFGYKEVSSFVPIDATNLGVVYNIQIRNAITNAVVRTQPMTAIAGKIYTIVVRGLVTPPANYTLNSLSSTLVTNN